MMVCGSQRRPLDQQVLIRRQELVLWLLEDLSASQQVLIRRQELVLWLLEGLSCQVAGSLDSL